MTWPSKNISLRNGRRWYGRNSSLIVKLLFVAFTAGATAGTYNRTSFTLANDGVSDSNLTAFSAGIGLAVEHTTTIKFTDDRILDYPQKTYYPDVATPAADTFSFFYVDTIAGRLMLQGYRLKTDGTVLPATAVKAFDISAPRECYLHADHGETGYCVSYVAKGSGNKRYLRIQNGVSAWNIDSAVSTGWLFPSQCRISGDTFAVIVSVDMSRLTLRKIYIRNSEMTVFAAATVAVGSATPGNAITNCSVAADGAGNICAFWTYGSPTGDKYLSYRFYSPDLQPGPSGSLSEPVCDQQFSYYDDIQAASYAAGEFVFVSRDNTGVSINRLTLDDNTVRISKERAFAAPEIYSCGISANSRYIILACIGDVDGNGTAGVEGFEYPIVDNSPGTPTVFSFSDPSVAVQTADRYSTALNIAIDDSDNVALTWRNGERVAGCIWSHRGIRYRRGFYTSPVESLQIENDSIEFRPCNVTLSGNASWYTEDSIRTGATPQACISAPWISLSNAQILRNNRTRNRYFQFRITINRSESGTIDSITTPLLSSVTIPYNVQPLITGIDSVIIGGGIQSFPGLGDTISILARRDSVRIFVSGYDLDQPSTLTFRFSLPASPQAIVSGGSRYYHASSKIPPLQKSDTIYACSLRVSDNEGWESRKETLFLRTRNSPPEISVSLVHRKNGSEADTFHVTKDTVVTVQEEDVVAFIYKASDGNDPSLVKAYIKKRTATALITLDSAVSSSGSVLVLQPAAMEPEDTLRFEVSGMDPDTVTVIRIGLIVNHKPVIRGIVASNDTIFANDTLNVIIGDTVFVTLLADDPDCGWWDTLSLGCRLQGSADSVRTTSLHATLRIFAEYGDGAALFCVSDRFGRSDSLQIHLAYPWYETDPARNPLYVSGKRKLTGDVSLVCGSKAADTVKIPLLNSGRSSFKAIGCSFTKESNAWLRVVIDDGEGKFTVFSSDTAFPRPVILEPGASVNLFFVLTAEKLTGDGVIADTMFLFTNDPRHRLDTFAVCLEHNDLPLIVSVGPYFVADRPYRSIPKRAGYFFPPHAAIRIDFSEPMDPSSAVGAITLYSVYDERVTGRKEPIPLLYNWIQNNTVLMLSPDYAVPGPGFRLKPPAGLFIPTDSLILVITSRLHDCAATRSGPNRLDINRDFIRDTDSDTAFGMSVDSIDFTVVQIYPEPGSINIARKPEIEITFSSPVYAASVDTSFTSNRSLTVVSDYSEGVPLPFEKIIVDGNKVIFRLGQELFYRDSIRCFYHSRYFCDRLGFSADNNRDGIDATMFDTASREDDLEWGYRVKPITVLSVEPQFGAQVSDAAPLIAIKFDNRIEKGTVDTDTSRYNRSFVVGSSRTGASSFAFIRITPDNTGVELQPRTVFFGRDSIYCIFRGFSSVYRYRNPINLPDPDKETFCGYEWWYRAADIGFYTFPNPYKPGSDPRHCRNSGPCGIWFKNLHTLGDNISEVVICIFNVNAHPVFDSRKRGEPIRFGDAAGGALPQWLWDTRNNHGETVGSGIYLYAIYSVDGRVLRKGKLVIVR